LLQANGRSWTDVFDGEAGAVEFAVVRNAFAHGTRIVNAAGAARLQAVGSALHTAGDSVSLTYEQLCRFRVRLRGILRYGGVDPRFAKAGDQIEPA
jgi:hypothetical protein